MKTNEFTPEQLQTQAAFAAWQLGEPIQYEMAGRWLDFASQNRPNICQFDWRPAPKPAPPRPWEFNSRPLGVVWVYKKGFVTDCMIMTWGDDVVVVATKHGLEWVNYDALLANYLQRDGSPCGITQPAP